MQALGQKKPGEEEQGNIFQQPQGAAPASGRIQASSTAGDLGGPASGGSSFAPQAAAPQGQSTTGAQNRLFSANVGKVKSPVDLAGVSKEITTAQAGAQAEADSYIATADDRYETNPDGSLKKAGDTVDQGNGKTGVYSGPDDAADLDDFVNGTYQPGLGDAGTPNEPPPRYVIDSYQNVPGQVEDLTLRTDTEVERASSLGTDAGLQSLFRQGGDAEYGANEASLDTALLRKDAGFNEERDNVLNQNRVMQDAVQKIRDNSRGAAQTRLNEAHGSWKGAIDRDLDGRISGYEKTAAAREAEFDKGLGGSSVPLESSFDYRPDVDAAGFTTAATLNADQTSWQDFVQEPEYQGFNRIMGLLGKEENKTLIGKGKYVDDKASKYAEQFDRDGYLKEAARLEREKAAAPFGDAYSNPYGPMTSFPTPTKPRVLERLPFDPTQIHQWNEPGDPDNDPILPDVIERPIESTLNTVFGTKKKKK